MPAQSDMVRLNNGASIHAISLGERVLARLPKGKGLRYLPGRRTIDGASADVRFVFTGLDGADAELAALVEADGLERFFIDHPDAQLIDVREAFEHAAGSDGALQGLSARSVPLSMLADRLSDWLRGEQPPLVFFCRSGGRSAKAARCLHRLGYRNAWSVEGGVALGGAAMASQGTLAMVA